VVHGLRAHNYGNNGKGAWVSVLSSSEVVLGKTRPKGRVFHKDKGRELGALQEKVTLVFFSLVPVSSRSFCLSHLHISQLLRVRDVRSCVARCPDLHTRPTSRTRVGLSCAHTIKTVGKKDLSQRQNKKQNTTTTEHDKIPSLVQKGKFCPSQKLFHLPPVDNDRKRLLKISILTKSLVFLT
jgi:hypothetical protein